jgi:type II secretory pathway pseudopilin PulG
MDLPCIQTVRTRESGQTLIEALIALLVFSVIATSFLGGIYASRTTATVMEEQSVAESLTRLEMEYVKQSPYWGLGFTYQLPGSPPPWDTDRTELDDVYASYSVTVVGTPIDTSSHDPLPAGIDQGMQRIRVQVFRDGEMLLSADTIKVNR